METEMKMTGFRWKIVLLVFLVGFLTYLDRVNLSVATPVIMKEFGFSKIDMGLLVTCFFAGYALMQVPGGILAEKFGFRRTGSLALLWWALFTTLTAFGKGKFSFAGIRLMLGLGEGPIFPSLSSAIFNWCNSKEKGTGSSCMLLGIFTGPVLGPIITVALISTFNWRFAFFLCGALGVLLSWSWYHLVRDKPSDSPYVNVAELAHINEDRVADTGEKQVAPWGKFLRSTQFWAMGIQFMVVDYIMYVFLAWLPLYLTEVTGVSLQEMGIYASFPWIALIVVTFLAGYISDLFAKSANSKRQYTMRTITAMIGIGVCSLGLYLASLSTDPLTNIFWMSVSLGFLGFGFSACWASVISLGGKYTGSVSGWTNFFGNIGGVLAPIVTAFLVTHFGWMNAFAITACFGIIGIIAWIFVRPGKPLVADAT